MSCSYVDKWLRAVNVLLQKKGIHVDLETDDTIARSKSTSGKFPGGPVARTQHFYC